MCVVFGGCFCGLGVERCYCFDIVFDVSERIVMVVMNEVELRF